MVSAVGVGGTEDRRSPHPNRAVCLGRHKMSGTVMFVHSITLSVQLSRILPRLLMPIMVSFMKACRLSLSDGDNGNQKALDLAPNVPIGCSTMFTQFACQVIFYAAHE